MGQISGQADGGAPVRLDAASWTGANGDVWAQEWQRTDRSFAGLSAHLDRAIGDAMGTGPVAIADIGCGAGATSLAAAGVNAQAQVTGIDISPTLIAVARTRAGSTPNIRFIAAPVEAAIGDAGPFDLIVSRHGVMFFDDPLDAFTRLRAAARPGARLVFSCFRAASLNVWARETMAAVGESPPSSAGYAPGPFAFADEDFVRHLLADAGWMDATAQPVDFPYRAGAGNDPVADAVSFFSRIGPAARPLKAADPAERMAITENVAALCRQRLEDGHVDFPAAAWIWSARNPL
ncbi:class I SAM-dependent methyltransferase [Sphingobium lactosutens]|uniref:class I SAM-dependent methyltransferase n=1 Tax=Sphingobium lactosutens TaxID=522773 RepID=UPI0015B93BA4|nr:class I SAM-dependent methyltransferase [Sphingobium lactosutens]NWK95920.1 class I SAM-dependent methyltransferase [Sphingobium lactosutens]